MFLILCGCTLVSDADIAGKFMGDSGAGAVGGDHDSDAPPDSDDTSEAADTAAAADTADSGGDTADAGYEIEPRTLLGRVFKFVLSDATIEEPPGIGSILGGYMTEPWVVEVEYADASSIDFLMGTGVREGDGTVTQELCAATGELERGDFAGNPRFGAGPGELTIDYAGSPLALTDVVYDGMFTEDLTEISEGALSMLMDTRPLDELLGSDVCDTVAAFGVECETCPDGSPECLFLRASDVTAEYVLGLDLVEVADGACD